MMRHYKKLLTALLLIVPVLNLHPLSYSVDFEEIEHPYLFFSKQDIPDIKKRMEKEPFRTRWQIFIRNADQILETSPRDYQAGFEKSGRARTHLENAGKTAFAYIITNNKKYARRAIDEAISMVRGIIPNEHEEWGWYNPDHRNWNKGADLNTAEICYALAMVYDWCYDALSESERQKIRTAIETKGIQHYLHSIEGKQQDFWVDNPVSNWAGVVNGGVGLAALAIYNESEDARKAVNYAQTYIPQFLDHVFLKDGGGHEGVMYARYGELFALYFLMAEQRLFGPDLEFLEQFNQKLAGYWDVYLFAPDSKYANFNNMNEPTFNVLWGSHHGYSGGPNSDINALMENFAGGDPLLLWAADNGAPRFYWEGASPWFFLWRRGEPDHVAVNEKPELQEAVLFRGAGHAVFQSEKLWLAYNGGWISNKSHNNKDIGSFILVVDEERMVNDPGYGDGHAMNHSTVVINGKDQIRGRAGKYLCFGSGENFHYLATDITNVYDKSDLEKFIRHMLMVNGKYIVMLDEVKVKNNAEMEWRLQTRSEAETFGNGHAVINGKDHRMYVLHTAEGVNTQITPWEGKNGKLNAISKKPKEKKNNHLLATVLFPVEKGNEVNSNIPTVAFNNGKLTVSNGESINETIIFEKGNGRWLLKEVNEEKNLSVYKANERTIQPFREMKSDINPDDLPQWFLPITK